MEVGSTKAQAHKCVLDRNTNFNIGIFTDTVNARSYTKNHTLYDYTFIACVAFYAFPGPSIFGKLKLNFVFVVLVVRP